MENEEEKNYTDMMDDSSQSEKSDGGKIVIHTMPKRYMISLPTANNAKSTGMFILIAGFIFLIIALTILYFKVLKKPTDIEIVKEPVSNEVESPSNTASSSDSKIDDNDSENNTTNPNEVATTTDENQASSTDPLLDINGSLIDTNKYQAANDSDKDGLSDIEELLLGSSPNSQDTDGDNFPDGLEVFNLFDPGSGGKLIDSLSIEELVNEDYNFMVFVASLWTIEKVAGNDSLIVSLGKDQYIQIISQDKDETQSLEEWYMDLFEVDNILDSQKFKKGNWNGIINNSKLTVYIEHPNKKHIITFNYEIGDDRTLYYKNIFDMMLQSIAINE